MSFFNTYYEYVKSAFVEHKYLFLITLLFAVFCWIGGYFIADIIFTPEELVDFEYLSQQTLFSFDDMMEIIFINCYINVQSYLESVFLCYGPIYDMTLNIGLSGITTRATELACGDPFLFIKLTCLHGFFEDLATILNSFAGFLLFYFIVRTIKDFFNPSQQLAEGKIRNSLRINKRMLYQSLAIFVLAFVIMIIAGVLEEYVSIPFGNFIAAVL
ncbi:stage II sporulation protein M [Methanobrevibacter sp.]|uniref:stage II sporulation protein M n=1 Tax=Methanobrevibacter sp. TaxID=66852 RepID=UPI00388F159D